MLAHRYAAIAIASMLALPLQAQEHSATDPLVAWFAAAPAARGALPNGTDALTRAQAESWLPKLVDACRRGSQQLGLDTLTQPSTNPATATAGELRIGTYSMPYVLLQKGEKPTSGWPLWICLHGGGGNDQAEGPHAWRVNTGEWDAQKRLFARVYQGVGLYFIPRMADDRKGRWWFDHNQIAFDEVIRKAILFRDVDPDRVYLMGISEGGYGAIRFAGNRPDRFAATGGMAAAEPLDTSPPENMRNVAMRIDIGEQDTMFDRIGLARRMGEKLAEWKAADPQGFDFVVNVQPGRGHGIDYSLTPKWLAEKTRQPWPRRVVWTVRAFDSIVDPHCYWLALPATPPSLPLYVNATLQDNHLVVTAELPGDKPDAPRVPAAAGSLLVRLNDALADLDQPLRITVNGRELPARQVARSLATMARTLAERWDPRYCFAAEISIDFAAK